MTTQQKSLCAPAHHDKKLGHIDNDSRWMGAGQDGSLCNRTVVGLAGLGTAAASVGKSTG